MKYWSVIIVFSITAAITAGMSSGAESQPAPASGPAPASQPAKGGDELLLFEEIPVVVAAAKHEQKTTEAPSAVTVVTAEEIELYGYRSLADILRTQRGFFTFSDGLNSFLGVRGFLRPGEWNARILVLVDGRPTREPIFGQTHIDQDFVVPVELIKRVEIIRGPGSVLYGSNAVFAVINIVTRNGADVKNWAELTAQGGNKDTGRGVAVVGKKFDNGVDFIAGASRFSTEGDEDIHFRGVGDADHNFGHIVDHDFEGAGSAFWKLTYQEFTFEADFMKRDRDNSDATYLALFNDPGRMMERRGSLSAQWDHKISDDQSLHVLAFYSEYAYRQHWGTDAGSGPYTYWSTAKSDWFGQDIHYDWQVTKNNRLTLGAEGMQTAMTSQIDFDTVNGTLLDVSPSLNWWALYVQDEYSPTSWLTLVGGLRMDKIQRFEPLFDPRLAAIIKLSKDDTLKLMYGRAFRAPNLYEMFYASPGANIPNPNLKPEINDTYEVLWGHDYAGGWHTDLGYYFWKMTNALGDVDTGDVVQTQNIGTLKAQGVEAEVTKKWSNGARIRLSANLGRAEDDEGNHLQHSPDILLSAVGAYPIINNRTFIAVETQMVGPTFSDTGSRAEASFFANVILTSRKVWKDMDVQVGVYNLFGQQAQIPRASAADQYEPLLKQPSPLFMFSVTYRF